MSLNFFLPYFVGDPFQENKMGMGIELEGAELLDWKFVQDVAARVTKLTDGVDKIATGSTNLLNEATNFTPPSNSDITDDSQMNENVEMVLDGAGQVAEALPNKQDARNAADATELVGDGLVMAAPLTGPAAPATAAVGGVIGTVGFGANLLMDVAEGDLEGATTRIIIEGVSGGMGSMTKRAGGDKVATELTNVVLARTGEAVQEITKRSEDEQK